MLHPFDYSDKILLIDSSTMDYMENLRILKQTKTKIVSTL